MTTERNINRFRQQLKSLGFSYDWDREVSTTDPAYYKCVVVGSHRTVFAISHLSTPFLCDIHMQRSQA